MQQHRSARSAAPNAATRRNVLADGARAARRRAVAARRVVEAAAANVVGGARAVGLNGRTVVRADTSALEAQLLRVDRRVRDRCSASIVGARFSRLIVVAGADVHAGFHILACDSGWAKAAVGRTTKAAVLHAVCRISVTDIT